MRQADNAQFLAHPLGQFASGRRVLVACPDAHLRICAVWGRPNADDARELLRLLEVVFHEQMVFPIDALTDVTAMTGVDPRAFYTLVGSLSRSRARFAERIRRQAFVRERSVVGAVVSGLYDIVGQTFPVRSFGDRREALSWLERPDAKSIDAWLSSMLPLAGLTLRERQALELAEQGHNNKSIAQEMRVSSATVRVLLHRAAAKLGARTRSELIERSTQRAARS